MSRPSHAVAARFFVVLAVLVPSMFAVVAVGTQGLQHVSGAVSFLYGNTVLTAQSASELSDRIAEAHRTALAILASDDATLRQRLYVDLRQRVVPSVDAGFAALRTHLEANEQAELTDLDSMATDWKRFVGLTATGDMTRRDAHLRSGSASEVSAALDPVIGLGRDIAHHEADQARAANAQAGRGQTRTMALMALVLGFLVLGSLGAAGLAGAARRRAERAEFEGLGVRRSEARFRALADHGDDVIVVIDTHAKVFEVSESMGRVLGHTVDEVVGSALTEWMHPDDRATVGSVLERVASGADGFVVKAEWRWRHRDGGWRDVETSVTNLLAHPEVAGIVLNARDVTHRRRLEEELRHGAFHDSLTGLANRALLHDRIAHAIARRHDGMAALVMLDLDGFKALNDSLGHPAGDHALIVVADRLRGLVRPQDTVARLGGDEFAVLVEDFEEPAEVENLAARIVQGLAEPLVWEGRSVVIGASVGVAFVDVGLHGSADLVRDADIALYAAKAAGRGQVRTFAPAMGDAVLDRFTVEGELRTALDRGEFVLHYQPVVELSSRRVVGFEALVRWAHPDRGLVSPLAFISIAEDSGLIVPLGRWVLGEACRAAAGWSARYPAHGLLKVSVNLSVRQLQDPDVIADVTAALAASGLDPGRLVLEITESVLAHDVEQAMERLCALKALGVRLAVDDFGTGYSSLSYLRRFPFDTVKVDKSFVDGVAAGGDDAAFVEAILALAGAMRLETLAEGIESADQADTLTWLDCRLGQGFHFAAPMEAGVVDVPLRQPLVSPAAPALAAAG